MKLDSVSRTSTAVMALRDDVLVGVATGPMNQAYIDEVVQIFQKCRKLHKNGIAIVLIIRQEALESPGETRQILIKLMSDYRDLVKRVAVINEASGPFSGSIARMIATAINLVTGKQQYQICHTRREAAQSAAKAVSDNGRADEVKVRGILEGLNEIERLAAEAA